MGRSAPRSSTLVGTLIVVVFLTFLILAPKLLTRHSFTADFGKIEEVPKFALNLKLPYFILPKQFSFVTRKAAGKSHPLSSYFGSRKTLLVNFWATWCPPCLDELPDLEILNRQLRDSSQGNLPQLVTISVDEETHVITQLFKTLDFKPSFLVLHDPDGDLARSLGTTKFPETFLINQEGKILHRWVGPQDWLSQEVLKKIEAHTS